MRCFHSQYRREKEDAHQSEVCRYDDVRRHRSFCWEPHYHYWDAGHRTYSPWRDQTICKLQLEEIYQPMGGSQPIHVKVRNISHNRLRYTLQMAVNGQDAGVFNVDNANPGELSDRDASRRYPGTLTDSRITIRVTSCSIPQ